MQISRRTPGYSYRRSGVREFQKDIAEDAKKLDIHNDDGNTTIPVRTAKPQDADRLNKEGGGRSPLR